MKRNADISQLQQDKMKVLIKKRITIRAIRRIHKIHRNHQYLRLIVSFNRVDPNRKQK